MTFSLSAALQRCAPSTCVLLCRVRVRPTQLTAASLASPVAFSRLPQQPTSAVAPGTMRRAAGVTVSIRMTPTAVWAALRLVGLAWGGLCRKTLSYPVLASAAVVVVAVAGKPPTGSWFAHHAQPAQRMLQTTLQSIGRVKVGRVKVVEGLKV